MNENTPQINYGSRREERRERRIERRNGKEWFAGILLILLGGIVFLQTMNIRMLDNWWALFILLPAIASFSDAWMHYRKAGNRFDKRARGSLFVGLVLTAVTTVFLFDWMWTITGPVLLAAAGLGLIINGMLPD
jgi:hypothetical protein